jgi:hypothetical protein
VKEPVPNLLAAGKLVFGMKREKFLILLIALL